MPRQLISRASLIPYVRTYLNAPAANQIWTDAYLLQLINQCEVWVFDAINTYWTRFAIPIQVGLGVYPMPGNIKGITRITYRGFKVDILSQRELSLLSPVYRTQQTRPRWASRQMDGTFALRLYPVPAENLPVLDSGTDVFTDKNLLNECIISSYMYAQEEDTNFSLPDYFVFRTVKHFVRWKSFAAEGVAQDLDVAQYHKKKFEGQIEKIIVANSRVFNNKSRQLADVAIQRPWKKFRPILPPNFGTPVDMY
jgi:hypothetical protein